MVRNDEGTMKGSVSGILTFTSFFLGEGGAKIIYLFN